MLLDLLVKCEGWSRLGPPEPLIEKTISSTLRTIDNRDKDAHISICLSDDAEVAELNQLWRNKPGPTNILSFPAPKMPAMSQDCDFLGDMILAYETIEREALLQDKPFPDHVSHLLIHGCLHLVGFDHQGEAAAQEMEAIEIKVMQGLGLPNPYERVQAN